MIQRIQSVFLLLSSICSFGLLSAPFGTTNTAIANSSLFADAQYTITDSFALLGLFIVAALLTLAAIFMYKNRTSQQLLGRISIILNLLGIVLVIILFMQDAPTLGSTTPTESFGLGLPILSMVFAYLGMRFIQKDQRLVDSMDRLR
ncbi:MAG: DUF4293 domain-containing protein [Saprospiraceae bacterium]|nr:DUF4293 domain-containing protein [Saprospiraceae bacterium]